MRISTAITMGLTVIALYAVYLGVLYIAQRWMLFPRPSAVPAVVPDDDREVIWLSTSGGNVESWYYPPADGVGPEVARSPSLTGASAVILAHGNAELIDTFPPEFMRFRDLGMALLLVEYPGYGRSQGSPSQASIAEALTAGYDALVARDEVDADRVILFGRSLGGGGVCALAARRPAAALILVSTFTSVREMANRYLAPQALVRDPFDNLTVVEGFDGPVLVVHGLDDGLIPVAHGERLSAAAADGRMLRYPCGHGDCPADWDRFWRDLAQFLRDKNLVAG